VKTRGQEFDDFKAAIERSGEEARLEARVRDAWIDVSTQLTELGYKLKAIQSRPSVDDALDLSNSLRGVAGFLDHFAELQKDKVAFEAEKTLATERKG